MITHDEFCKLRLREFCPGDDLYPEGEDEHGELLNETIRGIWFGRPITHPSDTYIMDVDLYDCSTDAGPAILARLGLSFTPHTTLQEVIELLGQPAAVYKPAPDHPLPYGELCTFKVDGAKGYDIRCAFEDSAASTDGPSSNRALELSLTSVRVDHCDLEAVMKEIEGYSERTRRRLRARARRCLENG